MVCPNDFYLKTSCVFNHNCLLQHFNISILYKALTYLFTYLQVYGESHVLYTVNS